ncbi:CAP domain-containing protein [Deinococcus koreensis]|nr:CAP domain-containing protein [Deinococcus koreensis]
MTPAGRDLPTPRTPSRRLRRAGLGLSLAALLAALPDTLQDSGRALAQSAGVPFQIGYSASSELRAPLLVTFHATMPADYRVEWTFGDGGAASGPQVRNTYYRAGSYTMQARLLDSGGRVVSRAEAKIDVKSGGPERGALTILLGQGQVRLSAVDSVLYTPAAPRLLLDGQEVGERPVSLNHGTHQATALVTLQDGRQQERRITFTAAPFSGSVPFESEVLRLTNRARARGWNCATLREGGASLPPLSQSAALDAAALAQSAGMALGGYFDHVSGLDGSTPLRRVLAAGLKPRAVAENIAAGQETPAEVVDGWLRSPGHCKNIMSDFGLIGLSFVNRPGTPYGRYWTQVFARL